MSKEKPSKTTLHSVTIIRQLALLGILVALCAVFAYDALLIRPSFRKAWEAIKNIDSSSESGAMTSVDVHLIIDKAASHVDDSRDDFSVETYSWKRCFGFSSYDIHVVYAKSKLTDKLFYYSAAAGMPLTRANFPQQTMVVNLNPPPISQSR